MAPWGTVRVLRQGQWMLTRQSAKDVLSLGSRLRGDWSRSMSTSMSPSNTSSDVLVVGAGIMGLNVAYQLSRRSPELTITILESAPGLGHGSSGYSTGFQRAYYSLDETMKFALTGINAYKNWGDYTGLGKSAEATFEKTGALWMLGYSPRENAHMQARMAAHGVSSHVLDSAGTQERFPLLSLEPYPVIDDQGQVVDQDHAEFSALYEEGAGHVDPGRCLSDLLKVCRQGGVKVHFNARAQRVSIKGGRAEGVVMEDGSLRKAGVVVNCAGPWGLRLNEEAGVRCSTRMRPVRIHVGHKYISQEFCNLPFVADGWGASGFYFMPRQANAQMVFGSLDDRFEQEEVDPDKYDAALDPDFKQEFLNMLHWRLPTLPTRGDIQGFAHMYTMNQDDMHPVIGETRIPGLWACNGFSGHGFKLAPAVGSLVAQQITAQHVGDVWETATSLDFFSPYRAPLTQTLRAGDVDGQAPDEKYHVLA